MYLEQSLVHGTQQSFTISAKVIASINILQYSAEELEQSIARELSENPALEVEEVAQCLRCGTPLRAGLCLACDRQSATESNDPRADLVSWDEEPPYQARDLAVAEETDYDPLDFVHNSATLQDHLLRQLGTCIAEDDKPIAEYLVGNLNSHGYVTVSLSEASETLRVDEARVRDVLEALQALDPIGIGARNVQECLLIQLRAFEERGEAPKIARVLIEHHLRELGSHRFAEIAREVGATAPQVKLVWQFIRTNLNPFPAHAFESAELPDQGLSADSERGMLVRPDVVIRRTEHGFEAEIVEQRRFRFNVNAMYHALQRQHRLTNSALHGSLSEHDRQHIRQYSTRARFFMECVRQRWETLNLIANALIEQQRGFLEHGVRHLRPLTRNDLAIEVGLHESTVSRATANKYVLLPNGRTIPFDDFFDGSLAAKDQMRELIASEIPGHAYSDEDLTALLHERGLVLARRTVAKYREAMGILPSRFRN